jgi:hypothetical protein
MFLVIKGQLNLSNYFSIMVLSTSLLVGVLIAACFLPFDKNGTGLLMAILSITSLGSSMKVMSIVDRESEE